MTPHPWNPQPHAITVVELKVSRLDHKVLNLKAHMRISCFDGTIVQYI